MWKCRKFKSEIYYLKFFLILNFSMTLFGDLIRFVVSDVVKMYKIFRVWNWQLEGLKIYVSWYETFRSPCKIWQRDMTDFSLCHSYNVSLEAASLV